MDHFESQNHNEGGNLDVLRTSTRLLLVVALAVSLGAGHWEFMKWMKKPQREAIAACLKKCSDDGGESCDFDGLEKVFYSDEDARKKVGVAWCAREVLEKKMADDQIGDDRDFRLNRDLLDVIHIDVEAVMKDEGLGIDW